jgi:hypothetical protein
VTADPPEAERGKGESRADEDRHLVPLEGPVSIGWLMGDGVMELRARVAAWNESG